MPHSARTQIVRLALIEGVVVALGAALVFLLAVVAGAIDPEFNPVSLTPPTR